MKKFTYQLQITDLEHSKDTVKEAFGTNFFNSDFPEDIHAIEDIDYLFKDAIAHCLDMQMELLVRNKESDGQMDQSSKRLNLEYIRRREVYSKLRDTLKCVKSELI